MINAERVQNTETNLLAWRQKKDEYALLDLLNDYMGLIRFVALKFQNYGIELEDLLSIGRLAFFKAAMAFDYLEHPFNEFSGYVATIVRNDIIDELQKSSKRVKAISLDTPVKTLVGGETVTLGGIIPSEAPQLDSIVATKIRNQNIRKAILTLTPEEQRIILLRYGFETGQEKLVSSVAKELHMSQTIVRRREEVARLKLKRELGNLVS